MIADAPITAIVPAPSTPWNLWRRGFSLAALAAADLAAGSGHPLALALRRRGGSKQTQLDATARKHNLQGKIRCRTPMHGVVLLVDDVLTTGATASACAAALRELGAAEIRFATLCAVPPPDPERERWTDPSESGM